LKKLPLNKVILQINFKIFHQMIIKL